MRGATTSLSLNGRGGGGGDGFSFPQSRKCRLWFPFGGIVYIELEGPMKIERFFTIPYFITCKSRTCPIWTGPLFSEDIMCCFHVGLGLLLCFYCLGDFENSLMLYFRFYYILDILLMSCCFYNIGHLNSTTTKHMAHRDTFMICKS